MSHGQDSGLRRSQQSVFYYSDLIGQEDPVLQAHPNYFEMLYPHMLIEDVSNQIMPVCTHWGDNQFRIFVTSSSNKVEKLIAEALKEPQSYALDFAAEVLNFFRRCAMTVMAYDEATYEIVYFSKPRIVTAVAFEFVPIQPQTVKWQRGKIVQYVPVEVARGRNVSQYVQLSPERILTFKPPKSVQGKLRRIIESLAELSRPAFANFAFPTEDGKPVQKSYDSTSHAQTRKLAVADATKLIGWNAREFPMEEGREYYWYYRQLLFEKFKIELRNSILGTLNEGIARAGRKVGFSAKLEIKGLPALKDVEQAQAHLLAGDRAFDEIMAPFRDF